MMIGLVVETLYQQFTEKRKTFADIAVHGTVFLILYVVYMTEIGKSIPFYLHTIKMYPFFIMGVLFTRHKQMKEKVTQSDALFATCVLLYIALWFIKLPINMAVTGFPAIILLVQLFITHDERIPHWLTVVGRYSLEIYIFHWFLLPSLPFIGDWITSQEHLIAHRVTFIPILMITAIFTSVIIPLCITTAHVVRQSKWLRMIVFGEVLFK